MRFVPVLICLLIASQASAEIPNADELREKRGWVHSNAVANEYEKAMASIEKQIWDDKPYAEVNVKFEETYQKIKEFLEPLHYTVSCRNSTGTGRHEGIWITVTVTW